MGRKKSGQRPQMNIRVSPEDVRRLDIIDGRLREAIGASDKSLAARYAFKLAVELGIELVGEVGGGRERWHEFDKPSHLPVSEFAGTDVVAYRVIGDSMESDHIIGGDYVLIRRQKTADHGAKVVAWIQDAGAVIKRYDANRIELYSGKGKEKWTYKLAETDNLFGVFVGVWRKA